MIVIRYRSAQKFDEYDHRNLTLQKHVLTILMISYAVPKIQSFVI